MTKPRHRLRKIKLDEISVVDLGADPNATIQIFKRGGADMPGDLDALTEQMQKAAEQLADTNQKLAAETALRKAAETRAANAEAALATAQASIAKSEAEADPYGAILKSADPAVAAAFKKLQAENEASAKMIAKMDEDRAIAKMAGEIAADMPNLPVKAEAFAPILKRAAGALPSEDFAELHRVLKAASSNLAKVMTAGGFGSSVIMKGSAETALDAKAAEIQKRDSVTFAKAYTQAVTENPGLYTDYLAEQKNRAQ